MRRKLHLLYQDLRDWLEGDVTRTYDLTALAGLVLVALGVWLIFPSLAVILVGCTLVAVGLLGAKAWAARKRRQPRDD